MSLQKQNVVELSDLYKDNVKFDSQELIEKIEMYRCATDSYQKNKLAENIVLLMKGLIMRDCKRYAGFAEFDDLFQEGCMAVFEHLPEYNPAITKPSTFFETHINGALQKKCYGGQTAHYHDSLKKLKRIAMQYYGHDELDLIDNVDLANLSGLSIATIKECKYQNSYTHVSITATGDIEATSYNSSPEQLMIEDEKKQLVVKAFSHLKPVEQFILWQYYLNDEKNVSIRALVQMLSQPEMKAKYGIVGTVDTKYVTATRERAMRILRQSPLLKPYNIEQDDYVGIQAFFKIEEVETEEADIEVAILDGLFD